MPAPSDAHTPGPWAVVATDSPDWRHVLAGGRVGRGRIIANVNAESGIDSSKAPAVAGYPMPADANARLIAAAPEMLAALQSLLADPYLADPINADRMAQARAAVARATSR